MFVIFIFAKMTKLLHRKILFIFRRHHIKGVNLWGLAQRKNEKNDYFTKYLYTNYGNWNDSHASMDEYFLW